MCGHSFQLCVWSTKSKEFKLERMFQFHERKSHWIGRFSVTTTLNKIGYETTFGVGLLWAPIPLKQLEGSSVTVKSLEYNWAKMFCISRWILNQQIHPAWDWIIGQSYSGGDGGDNSLGSRFPYCYTPCRPHAAIARLGLWEVASIRDNINLAAMKVQLTPCNNPVPVFWSASLQ